MVQHCCLRVWLMGVMIITFGLFFSQSTAFSATGAGPVVVSSNVQEAVLPMDLKADRLTYDGVTGWAQGIGHAVITRGDEQLRADSIKFNQETQEAEAVGAVVLLKLAPLATNDVSTNAVSMKAGSTNVTVVGSNLQTNISARSYVTVWTGNKLKYNFKTRHGTAKNMAYNFTPFYIQSKSVEQVSQKEYMMKDATITTCTNAPGDYHYYVSADDADLIQKEKLVAHHAVFRVGGVPLLYLPVWRRNLNDDCGFRFYPGYNSAMGVFLLSLYKYRLNPYLKSVTHLDYRSRRGAAYGQDLEWGSPSTNSIWKGVVSGYFLNDKDPTLEGERTPESVKDSRYRVGVKHSQSFSDRDYLLSQAQYLSDPFLNMDFFEDEYREANQPDNYLAYTHRGDNYTGNLLLRSRINDFYTTVNRLPEVSMDFMRQEIPDSYFYYEGRTAASFLQKTYMTDTNSPDYLALPDYSVFRIDSANMIYLPERFFGFLNFIPRAGYRATYYSETMQQSTTVTTGLTTTATTSQDAFGRTNTTVSSVLSTNTLTQTLKESAKLRSRYEFGAETSFRAFRTWDDEYGGWRHIVEPYANYTFIPEPNLLSENLYQFDDIDQLGKDHSVKLGVRNKLQTKVDGAPYNLVDADIYTRYLFERGDRSTAIDNVSFDLKTWPARGVSVFFDGMYDTEASVLSTFNTRLNLAPLDFFSVGLEHRYSYNSSSLMSVMASLSPNRNWTFEVYGRYEMETSQLQEEWFYISRKTDCITLRTGAGLLPGYNDSGEPKDEWRFVVEIWLNAFPETIPGRHKN